MKILFLNMLSVSFFTTVFIGVFCLVCRAVNRRWGSALTWTLCRIPVITASSASERAWSEKLSVEKGNWRNYAEQNEI